MSLEYAASRYRFKHSTTEPLHSLYKLTCVSFENSDNPAHLHRLIRVLNGHQMEDQWLNVISDGKLSPLIRNDLNLRLTHLPVCTLCWAPASPCLTFMFQELYWATFCYEWNQSFDISHCEAVSSVLACQTGAGQGFLERGFIYRKAKGFALLILSHFS